MCDGIGASRANARAGLGRYGARGWYGLGCPRLSWFPRLRGSGATPIVGPGTMFPGVEDAAKIVASDSAGGFNNWFRGAQRRGQQVNSRFRPGQ